MSGLVVRVGRGASVDPGDRVSAALAVAPHRGSVTEVATCGAVVLGLARRPHDRESGIASDAAGAIAVAGTVDNLAEIHAGIPEEQRPPEGAAPPVILLAHHRAHGRDAPARLRGAFAIAVTDGRSVDAYRDQLGAGTLFFREQGDATWLASEAKQVVAAADLSRQPDLDVLEAIFYGEEEDATSSALAGVSRVPKATVLSVGPDESRRRRIWEPERLLERGDVAADEVVPRFRALLRRAVERQLRGNDILALSGGIDSPAVAAFAAPAHRERTGRPLPALSMIFPDYPGADESRYIDAVVQALELELHAYQPDPASQRLERLGTWTHLADGPWAGAWQPGMDEDRYAMISALGLTNLLTGDVAEYLMDFRRHLLAHLILRRRGRAVAAEMRGQRATAVPWIGIARQVATAFVPGSVFRAWRRGRPRFPSPVWVDRTRVRRVAASELVAPRDRWRHQQLAGFRGPGIALEAYQIHQEAHGVVVRRPWADVDLWEFFLGLRAEVKFPPGRWKEFTRQAMRGLLPDAVLDRTDKTLLDSFARAGQDYPSIRRWLDAAASFRMAGVDYATLRSRLEREDFGVFEYLWAKDLATAHAFVAGWEGTVDD